MIGPLLLGGALFVAAGTPQQAELPTHEVLEVSKWESVSTRSHDDGGDIEVSKTEVAGVACYRGVLKTQLKSEVMLEVISDVTGAREWASVDIPEAALLSRKGTRLDYYQYLDVPGWTFSSDRFWFLYADIEQKGQDIAFRWDRLVEGGEHRATFERVKENHPSAIEPPINVGGWYFVQEGKQTRVTYAICSDVGGSVPMALQKFGTQQTLPDTMGDMIREARRRSLKGKTKSEG